MAEGINPGYAEILQQRNEARADLDAARATDRQEGSEQSRAERMAKSREYGMAKSEVWRARREIGVNFVKNKFGKLTEGLGSFFKKFSGENRAQFVENARAKFEDVQAEVTEKVDDIRFKATEKVAGVIEGAQQKWLESRIAKGESKVESQGAKILEVMNKITDAEEEIARMEREQNKDKLEINRCEHVTGLTKDMSVAGAVEASMRKEMGRVEGRIEDRNNEIRYQQERIDLLWDKQEQLTEKQQKVREKLEKRRNKYNGLKGFLQLEGGIGSGQEEVVAPTAPENEMAEAPQLPAHQEGDQTVYNGDMGVNVA